MRRRLFTVVSGSGGGGRRDEEFYQRSFMYSVVVVAVAALHVKFEEFCLLIKRRARMLSATSGLVHYKKEEVKCVYLN